MLKDVPYATQYVLMPVSAPSVIIPVGDARPCGDSIPNTTPITFSQLLMNEVGRILEDTDVVGYGGIAGGRMMIIVHVSKEDCYKLLDGALMAVDEIWKNNPHLVPVGGVGYAVRDWDTIPDAEKAGHEKK